MAALRRLSALRPFHGFGREEVDITDLATKSFRGGKLLYVPKPQSLQRPLIIYPKKDPLTGWTRESRRTGLLMLKAGMTHDWNEWGIYMPLTVLQLTDCMVVAHKTQEHDGYTAMQLGIFGVRADKLRRSVKGEFAKWGVAPRRHLEEFRCTPDALLPPGTTFDIRHFMAGQRVDVAGLTIGKGFQGGMKRHGFRGMAATHGTSTVHRSIGATGARQDPGKVWKGKKMAGHMGNVRRTHKNLLVYEVDVENKCILVKGHVMGKPGNVIRVTDTTNYKFEFVPPFPTFTESLLPRYVNKNMHVYRLNEGDAVHSYYATFRRPWGKDIEEQFQPHLYDRMRMANEAIKAKEDEERRKAQERAERLRRLLES